MLFRPWWEDTVEGETILLRPSHNLGRLHVHRPQVLIEFDHNLSTLSLLYRVRWSKSLRAREAGHCSARHKREIIGETEDAPTYDLDVRR